MSEPGSMIGLARAYFDAGARDVVVEYDAERGQEYIVLTYLGAPDSVRFRIPMDQAISVAEGIVSIASD